MLEEIPTWDDEADVVIIGAGAVGLPAAVAAREAGASVIIVEANFDIGGHAAVSGGNLPLGGGTSQQIASGIEDSPDLLFSDLTDWSVVQSNGAPDYRYNDREVIRAYADKAPSTYDWLQQHGCVFIDAPTDNRGAQSTGNSVPREAHFAAMDWVQYQTGKPQPPERGPVTSSGIGLVRPMEATARRLGAKIMLKHRMTALVRPGGTSGRVVGVRVDNEGRELHIRARKAVIIGTGGSTGNVNFRRIFDPRLTEEYCGLSGEPFSVQDASGELAAMAVGASLWGAANYSGEFGWVVTKPGRIGCQYGYVNLAWMPGSPVFDKARAMGLRVEDWQDVILVNQAGKRFYDETGAQPGANSYNAVPDYVPGSWRNAANVTYAPAQLPQRGDGRYRRAAQRRRTDLGDLRLAGPLQRESWTPEPPHVDIADGLFLQQQHDRRARLQHQEPAHAQPPCLLPSWKRRCARYNGFVDAGEDADFAKPTPQVQDRGAALLRRLGHAGDPRLARRPAHRRQVPASLDLYGQVIPGLYCGGESAGGFSTHGLARAVVQGRIAGEQAAAGDRAGVAPLHAPKSRLERLRAVRRNKLEAKNLPSVTGASAARRRRGDLPGRCVWLSRASFDSRRSR